MRREPPNAWIDRFDATWTDEEIAHRIAVHAVPATNLHERAPSDAAAELQRRLSSIFVPSRQTISIIRRLLGVARAHAACHYPHRQAYLRGINAPECPLRELPALCITGLAGSGKSEIARAVSRLLPTGPTVDPGSGYQPVALEAVWRVTVNERKSLKTLLEQPLLGRLGGLASFKSDAKLCEQAGRLAFQLGVALLIADELQFKTLGTSANAMLTALLYQLRYIGLPLVFIGNFSQCHRLLKRPQEDQHRLLTDPIIVVPDKVGDPSLRLLYKQYGIASDGALCSKPDEQVEKIEYYCAGVKRNRRDLLVLAYRFARDKGRCEVTNADLDAAYRSTAFTIYRSEVEALRSQDASGRRVRGRDDLWCPFALPVGTAEKARLEARTEEQVQVGRQAVLSSMTAPERAALAAVERQQAASSSGVAPVARKQRRTGPDLEELMAGTEKYLRSLSPAPKGRS